MALQAKYTAFLADATTDLLAADASMHYIPTLTSLNDPVAILKHIKTQEQVITKKEEKLISVIENSDSLCVETETTLQFVLNGGTYLPGLDDNFLAEKTATFPILHIVTFNESQKIRQIRLYWDQGCLLKAVDTIGARGRNWPINSGQDQVRLITSSTASVPESTGASAAEEERTGRPKSRGVDPHASLSLFAQRDVNSSARDESPRNAVAPRASAKPAPREWGELFSNGDGRTSERPLSPSKLDNPVKAGAGKHYGDIRLFSPENAEPVRELGIKTDAKKYNHFEFGEAEFKPSPAKNSRSKHMSQWDFEDFVTPQKPKERKTALPNRNFELNEVTAAGNDVAETPKPPVWAEKHPHPRKDAASHFDFGDSAPVVERPMIARTSKALGLYKDPVFGDDVPEEASASANATPTAPAPAATSGEQEKVPLGNITNAGSNSNNTHRSTFEPHWEMTDTPTPPPAGNENNTATGKSISEFAKRGARDMGAHWDMADESPPVQPSRGIKILGNAAGSSRAAEKKWWDYS